MKTHRILGILWLAYCSFYGISLLWQLVSFVFAPKARITPDLFLAISVCLLYLAGAVASIFLFRGVQWARRFVGLVAAFTVIAAVAQIIAFRSLSIAGGFCSLFAIISVVLIFFPKHEPVA